MDPITMLVGGQILGGLFGARSARKAAATQAAATREGIASQERMFERQLAMQEPFRQAGITGQNEYMRLLGLGGDPTSAGYGSMRSGFMPENYMQQIDPGYNFRLSEGLKALQKSAAARGGFLSGKTLKDITGYGQELASQEYQNAFNRYQTAREATLNPYANLAGMGRDVTGAMSGMAGDYGARQAELITGAGNARASGYIGATNALTSGFSNALNTGMQLNFLNSLQNQAPRGEVLSPGGSNNVLSTSQVIANALNRRPGYP